MPGQGGFCSAPGPSVMEAQRPGWDQSSSTAEKIWGKSGPIPAKVGYCSLEGNRRNTQTSPSLPLKHISPFCSLHLHLHCVCRSRRVYKVHQDICYKESCESTTSKRTSSRYSPQQPTGCASDPGQGKGLAAVPQHAGAPQAGGGLLRGADRTKACMDGQCCVFACGQWPRGRGLTLLSSLLLQKAKQQSHTEEAIEVSTSSSPAQMQAGAVLVQGVREMGAGQGTTLAHATMSRGCEGLWLRAPWWLGWRSRRECSASPGSAAPYEQEIPA